MRSYQIFNRKISGKIFAPRRQDRKGKFFLFFPTWRPLRLCESHLFPELSFEGRTKIPKIFAWFFAFLPSCMVHFCGWAKPIESYGSIFRRVLNVLAFH
jgi:hypothetical protein